MRKLEKLRARGCEGLYRDAYSKIIYYRKYRKGRSDTTKSLKTRDIEEAKLERDQLLENLYSGVKRAKALSKQAKTALELFDAWIARKEDQNKSKATIVSIKSSRAHFAPYLETMLPDEISAEWWETVYIREVRAKTHRGRRFFNDRKWLNSFLRQMQEDGILSRVPKLANPDSKESVGKVYSDEEVATLLNFAQNEDLHLAILMAATMGMRRSEIFQLRADRVDLEKSLIRLRREDTKTRRARAFSISPDVLPLLTQRAKSGSQWIFPSKEHKSQPLHKDGFYTAWNNLKITCSVEGRFHDLRHTFLTKAFNAAGANPSQICAYAGLSLEVAERVYLHLTEEDSRAVGGLVSYG
jgi:integrase